MVDYPARDMTITVEAGITMSQLAATLAAERQWLPIDAPQAASATLGGVVATAASGPRRYGYGTMRDYVIGISAVDGRGMPFKGGGRVVKNVAGYDFCKLLTGSLGTLGIVSQVTLKIKPLPRASSFLVADLPDLEAAERLLAALIDSATTPAAIELLAGPHWQDHPQLGMLTAGETCRLAVGLEGTDDRSRWMLERLAPNGASWASRRAGDQRRQRGTGVERSGRVPRRRGAAGAQGQRAPQSGNAVVAAVRAVDPLASIQAHAGNGIVLARFAAFEPGDVSRGLIGSCSRRPCWPAGHASVLSSTLEGLTRQAVWGGVDDDFAWMERVKAQFDPKGLLNPGRFVYANS